MSPPLLISTVTLPAVMKSSAENHADLATAAGSNADKDTMDVDDSTPPDNMIADQSCDKDDKPPPMTESSPVSEVVELSAVDSELRISTDDDWLTSLLRYDDEATSSSNGDS